jgi:DNA-binding protein HU-beta
MNPALNTTLLRFPDRGANGHGSAFLALFSEHSPATILRDIWAVLLRKMGVLDVFLAFSGDFFIFHLLRNRFRPSQFALMAKALTKSQIAAAIAETVGITKKQATEALQSTVELAYKNAKNSFTLPGLGKLVLVNRKARMGRNPATGEAIKIAAKKVVKFRVAKAVKDAIVPPKKK